MGLTLAKIARNVATVNLYYSGEEIHIEYYPARVTEKTYASLTAFASMTNETIDSGFKTLNKILGLLIKEWNVFDDEAETIMYPLTQDKLSELPILFRTAVLQAILSDIRPETLAPQNSQN